MLNMTIWTNDGQNRQMLQVKYDSSKIVVLFSKERRF